MRLAGLLFSHNCFFVLRIKDFALVQTQESPIYDFERRFSLALATRRYLRTMKAFNAASRDFTDACKTLREAMPEDGRFVIEIEYQHYLLTSDSDGNFEVEPIESV
jgi:hypothetical protein